jgi:hypothetical protein
MRPFDAPGPVGQASGSHKVMACHYSSLREPTSAMARCLLMAAMLLCGCVLRASAQECVPPNSTTLEIIAAR